MVLGLAASLDLEVEQMDVKTAFLHGDLSKNVIKILKFSIYKKTLVIVVVIALKENNINSLLKKITCENFN